MDINPKIETTVKVDLHFGGVALTESEAHSLVEEMCRYIEHSHGFDFEVEHYVKEVTEEDNDD